MECYKLIINKIKLIDNNDFSNKNLDIFEDFKIDINNYINLCNKIKMNKFNFKPLKLDNYNNLKCNNIEDLIIQQAIIIILEIIYEPLLINSTYKSILSNINNNGLNYIWIIKNENINLNLISHNKIKLEINKIINCNIFNNLINQLIDYKYYKYNNNNIIIKSIYGLPLNVLYTSIFMEIILNSLDKYIKNLINCNKNNNYMYLRYKNNIIIFINTSYNNCKKIKNEINNFINKEYYDINILSNNLKNISKIKIINQNQSKYFQFIDLDIFKTNNNKYIYKIPIKNIINKLIILGICKNNKQGEIISKSRTNLFNLSHNKILNWYNLQIIKILNYYSFIPNYKYKLKTIIWLFHASCALTLGNKYKLKTMKKVFTKFGRSLKDIKTNIKIYK